MKQTLKGLIDWSLYGALLRHQRTSVIGFRKAEEFTDALWRRTRVFISRDVLYKIERGDRAPDTVEFMALNKAVYGSFFPEAIIKQCMCEEWKALSDDYDPKEPCITEKWALENIDQAIQDFDLSSDADCFVCADATKDVPHVFDPSK